MRRTHSVASTAAADAANGLRPPPPRLSPPLLCRLSTLALLFVPAIGWVGFNILGPLFNQLNRMGEMNDEAPTKSKRRGVASAISLGAGLSLLAAQQADAATEMAQLAGDNR